MSDEEDERHTGRRKERDTVKLEWRDYVAIGIAALQTVLLPIVLLLFAVVIISILLRVFVFR
jgi:hypothetical protein